MGRAQRNPSWTPADALGRLPDPGTLLAGRSQAYCRRPPPCHPRDRTLVDRLNGRPEHERSGNGLVVSPQPRENGRMSTPYRDLLAALPAPPKTCLVTGVAGFSGSNLLETPLALDQTLVGLDNFATGHRRHFNVFGPRKPPQAPMPPSAPHGPPPSSPARRSSSTATAKPAATSATSTTPSRPTSRPRPSVTRPPSIRSILSPSASAPRSTHASRPSARHAHPASPIRATSSRTIAISDRATCVTPWPISTRRGGGSGMRPAHRLGDGLAEAMD